MIRQAHLCAALSLTLAVLATVLLYQPDASSTPNAEATSETTQTVIAEPVPELTPGSPWIEPPSATNPQRAGLSGQPREAFATVAAGERLEDVARRVYGTAEAAERLWRANRDTLSRPDSPLEPGTLLRTP